MRPFAETGLHLLYLISRWSQEPGASCSASFSPFRGRPSRLSFGSFVTNSHPVVSSLRHLISKAGGGGWLLRRGRPSCTVCGFPHEALGGPFSRMREMVASRGCLKKPSHQVFLLVAVGLLHLTCLSASEGALNLKAWLQ